MKKFKKAFKDSFKNISVQCFDVFSFTYDAKDVNNPLLNGTKKMKYKHLTETDIKPATNPITFMFIDKKIHSNLSSRINKNFYLNRISFISLGSLTAFLRNGNFVNLYKIFNFFLCCFEASHSGIGNTYYTRTYRSPR